MFGHKRLLHSCLDFTMQQDVLLFYNIIVNGDTFIVGSLEIRILIIILLVLQFQYF